ncbi:MAG: hypothetical protein AAB604_00520, partial [Patescibacteria group bacterium]
MNERPSHSGIIILVLFLIAVAGGLWWWRGSNQGDQHDTYGAQYYEDLAQRYTEDTFGGATPEETLELFIAALEAGNIDLASKYFVAEKQEEWKKNLENIKANNVLENMISDLKRAEREKDLVEGESARFT